MIGDDIDHKIPEGNGRSLAQPIVYITYTSNERGRVSNPEPLGQCLVRLTLTLKLLGHFFQNVISFFDAVHLMCNSFIWNWSNTMNVNSALWILMAWCFRTMASVATVLTTHPCVSRCLRVKESAKFTSPSPVVGNTLISGGLSSHTTDNAVNSMSRHLHEWRMNDYIVQCQLTKIKQYHT